MSVAFELHVMHTRFSFMPLFFLGVAAAGCSSSTVPAHDLDATLAIDGVETHAVLSFPEHDGDAHHNAGDSTCSLQSGNCGSDTASDAKVSGDAPIFRAAMTTLSDGSSITYDIYVNRPPDDPANAPPTDARPHYDHALCRVYDSQVDKPVDCSYTLKKMTLTLHRR